MANTSGTGNKKISQLDVKTILTSNQAYFWIPAAEYDYINNSYHNLAINLKAITKYSNTYSAYYIEDLRTYLSTLINDNKIDYDDLISRLYSYSYDMISDKISNLPNNTSYVISYNSEVPSYTYTTYTINVTYASNNGNKKISELDVKTILTSNQSNSWIPIAEYNIDDNTYKNLALSLKAITKYSNSYTSYYIDKLRDDIPSIVNKEEIDYNKIIRNCNSYSYSIISDKIGDLSKKISNLISTSDKTSSSNSYIRNNSKKISELTPRSYITKFQDHSWFVVAQYDSRINAYHNIAMNIKSLTSYSIDTVTYYLGDVNNLINITYANSDNLGYLINNSYIAYNIANYSISTSKDYFEWQFL